MVLPFFVSVIVLVQQCFTLAERSTVVNLHGSLPAIPQPQARAATAIYVSDRGVDFFGFEGEEVAGVGECG